MADCGARPLPGVWGRFPVPATTSTFQGGQPRKRRQPVIPRLSYAVRQRGLAARGKPTNSSN